MKNIVILLIILGTCFSLSAAVLWDEAVAIRQGTNIEWFRTGIETSDGGAIYVWSDTKLGERDLWAQKVDANGNMCWGNPVADGSTAEDPVITRTSDNNYIIAWIDFSTIPMEMSCPENNQAPCCGRWEVSLSRAHRNPDLAHIEPDNAGGAYMLV